MTNTYLDKSYAYAVARLRHEELSLLDRAFMASLLETGSFSEAVKLLSGRGWGGGSTDPEEMYSFEDERLWAYIDEIVPDMNVFNVFRVGKDFHNLKAALKESVMEFPYPGIYMDGGTVPCEEIREAVGNRAYKLLPGDMAEIAEKAHEAFLRTGDAQLMDIMVDRELLFAMRAAAAASGNEFIKEYAELFVGAADIKIAVRAVRTARDRDFLNTALADCSCFSLSGLVSAAAGGEEAIAQFLLSTDFAGAGPEFSRSLAAFECWCDNLITDRMRTMHYEAFGPGPIAAYIIARENEIKSVRIVLSGLMNEFPARAIAERVRDTYV